MQPKPGAKARIKLLKGLHARSRILLCAGRLEWQQEISKLPGAPAAGNFCPAVAMCVSRGHGQQCAPASGSAKRYAGGRLTQSGFYIDIESRNRRSVPGKAAHRP